MDLNKTVCEATSKLMDEKNECPVCLDNEAKMPFDEHLNHKVCLICARAYDSDLKKYKLERCPICRSEPGIHLKFYRSINPPSLEKLSLITLQDLKSVKHGVLQIKSSAGRECTQCKYKMDTCVIWSRCFHCKVPLTHFVVERDCKAKCLPVYDLKNQKSSDNKKKLYGVIIKFDATLSIDDPFDVPGCRCGYAEFAQFMFLSFKSYSYLDSGLYHLYPESYVIGGDGDLMYPDDFPFLFQEKYYFRKCECLFIQ